MAKNITKTWLQLLIISTLITTVPKPAYASGGIVDSFVDSFVEEFQKVKSYFTNFFDEFTNLPETIDNDLKSALEDSMGVLGIPDVEDVRASIEESLQKSDYPIYEGEKLANEVERQVARASASRVLSQEGQQQSIQELKQMQDTVSQVEQSAQTAQNQTVTQNVIKEVALQNARQAAILGSLQAATVEEAQRQEISNMLQSNISRALDGQTQADQYQKLGAGMETLRITSLSGLF
ncbi:hypothetical protein BJP34_04810 [Moorena producens PAL-8-15-08-1]|uniref:P-type conjugative transfer protein TrbJ n=1 Tax=Moorena producens PAL-8-15-08-1 TaxID=1458985 RepID=A0A1D8TMR0_9CYAN|nr:hypothetical protein [Moorena producens]AOW98862.1 hypothetical protein BJP34_04810 [Moorena producens PAL-8-15-08-1]